MPSGEYFGQHCAIRHISVDATRFIFPWSDCHDPSQSPRRSGANGRANQCERKTIMTTELSKWSQTERAAGEKTATAWETFFHGLRKDSIERVEEIQETARITEVQDKHEAELLALDNVVGVAPSLKMKGKKPTKTWSIRHSFAVHLGCLLS